GDLRKGLARNRPGEAEAADVPVRQARHGYRGAQAGAALVVPDRAVPVIRQGLEDQLEPLPEPGSGEHLAGQIAPPEEIPTKAGFPSSGNVAGRAMGPGVRPDYV